MTLYTRRQILVLLVLLAIAGFGLAVGHWRRARPDAVDYLEQLDRAPAPSSNLTAPRPGEEPSSSPSSDPEPRPKRRMKDPRESERPPGAPADAPADAIDLNRATTVELTRLPGIGPALARRIVDVRDADGPFARVEELEHIRGMSARKVEKLRAFVTISR
jgi:competence ComEA-like helix-hairpin-helix protein